MALPTRNATRAMPSDWIAFVDVNVLIQADDGQDPHRHAQARAWLLALWQRRAGRLSTQVLNTYYIRVTRCLQPAMPQGDARARVRRLQMWRPWQIDHQTVETAWGLEARHGLSYGDSLVIAAAQHAGCTHVLSEEFAHGQRYGAVQIINPYVVTVDQLDALP